MKSATVSTMESDPMRLLAWAEHGEEVTILRDDRVVARLVPAPAAQASDEPSAEEIRQYWRAHQPVGPQSEVTGADLVAWGRDEE